MSISANPVNGRALLYKEVTGSRKSTWKNAIDQRIEEITKFEKDFSDFQERKCNFDFSSLKFVVLTENHTKAENEKTVEELDENSAEKIKEAAGKLEKDAVEFLAMSMHESIYKEKVTTATGTTSRKGGKRASIGSREKTQIKIDVSAYLMSKLVRKSANDERIVSPHLLKIFTKISEGKMLRADAKATKKAEREADKIAEQEEINKIAQQHMAKLNVTPTKARDSLKGPLNASQNDSSTPPKSVEEKIAILKGQKPPVKPANGGDESPVKDPDDFKLPSPTLNAVDDAAKNAAAAAAASSAASGSAQTKLKELKSTVASTIDELKKARELKKIAADASTDTSKPEEKKAAATVADADKTDADDKVDAAKPKTAEAPATEQGDETKLNTDDVADVNKTEETKEEDKKTETDKKDQDTKPKEEPKKSEGFLGWVSWFCSLPVRFFKWLFGIKQA